MEPAGYIRIYREPEKCMEEEAAKEVDKSKVVLHTIANSVLLNIGLSALLLEIFVIIPFYIGALTLVTAAAIPAIEYATYLAARSKGGKGDFWKQLNITNHYLTPIFFVFFIFFAFFAWVLPENVSLGLDVIGFFLILKMNRSKIKAVHGMECSRWISFAYAALTSVAYAIWMAVFLSPMIIAILL